MTSASEPSPGGGGRPQADGEVADSATEPQRLHPLTPIATTLPIVVGLFFLTLFLGGGGAWRYGLAGVPAGLVVCLLGFVVIAGYRYLLWQRFEYWFDGVGDLRIDSGLLYRNQRKVQLSRLQAVDIERPLLARIFGLAELKIDVAGVGDSKIQLAYLSSAQALSLRGDLLSRARVSGQPDAPAQETIINAVRGSDLVLSLLLRTSTAGLLALTGFLCVTTVVTSGAVGLLLLPFTGGIPLFIVFSEFLTLYGFTVAKAHDGVRLRHGLLRTQAQTVPMGRVMAVDVIEPLLWRPKGWVRVRLTIAGVAGGEAGNDDTRSAHSILLPVASREVADEVLRHVLPDVDIESVPLLSAPRKSRWRAPIQWSRLAFGHSEEVFVARSGLITRHLCAVPHARTQSVSIVQGPWQRRLGLSTLEVDIPPGPVRVKALYFPADVIRTAADSQIARARESRAGDWASGGLS